MEKNPKVVEKRTVTVTYDIEAAIYDDGTVGGPYWNRRTAEEWKKASSDNDYASDRAEAKALYELALEVAPKPEEPTRFGFVGTVTTPEGKVWDVTCTLNADYRRVFTVYSPGVGVIEGGVSWGRILNFGTFTQRGEGTCSS